jgi:microcystin-dependent protein
MSALDLNVRSDQASLGVQDDRPLTDQERQLVTRLFSDPFSFPLAFKTWLVSYLEGSDMSMPMSSVQGLSGILGLTGAGSGVLGSLPAGLIFPFGGSSAPIGSLLCDGLSYPTANQNRLFQVIGYNFGGSGPNFNVPDLRGRMPVGFGPGGDVNAFAKNDGAAANVRGPRHQHTVNDPGHSHAYIGPSSPATGGQSHTGGAPEADLQSSHVGTGITVGVGGQVDTPAFQVVNFIIVA